MNAFRTPYFLCVLICVGTAGCRPDSGPQPSAPTPDTIALVGTVPLYQKDLDHAQAIAGNRSPEETLRELANEEALAQLAVAEGLADDPSVRSAVRRLLAARLREKSTVSFTIAPEEIAAAMAKETSGVPGAAPEYQVAYLRQQFATAGSGDAAVSALERARADFLALPLDSSRQGFGVIAATVSDDPDTRYQGGDAGWISQGNPHPLLPAALTTALTALPKPGLLPEIIRSADAAWLGMVTRIKVPQAPQPSPAKIEARLRGESLGRQNRDLLDRALTANPLLILKPAAAPSSPAPPGPSVPPLLPE